MKAALLIDWENVRNALNEQGLHCHSSGDVGRGLLQAAQVKAAASGMSLEYNAVFAPPISIPESERQELVNAGLEVVFTPAGPQAADMALSLKALSLAAISGYTLFFVAANDAGFVQLATQLQGVRTTCWLWPVSPKRVRPEVRNWHLIAYMTGASDPQANLLPWLKPCPSVPTDELSLFVLGCHQLSVDGNALWSYPRGIKALARLGYLGPEENVKKLWSRADAKGYFRTDYVAATSGRDEPRRRLAYENREVVRALALCDAVLLALAKRGGSISREQAFSALNHPLLEGPSQAASILEVLVKAQWVTERDPIRCIDEMKAHGTLNVLRRAALIAWGQCLRSADGRVSMTKLARRWPEHVVRRPGRHFNLLREQGNSIVQMAKVAGLLIDHARDATHDHMTYSLREEHPVSRSVMTDTCAAVGLVIRLAGASGKVPQDQLFGEMARDNKLGATDAERGALIGMLAAEKVLHWKEGVIWVQPDSPVVRACHARTHTPAPVSREAATLP